jgi:hypothetical protein
LSKKEKEDLTSDYSNCVIEGCLDLDMNRMVIPDLANIFQAMSAINIVMIF